MIYIAHKRFKGNAICGAVNLPYGTEVQSINGVLFANDKPICADHSQNAYDHFARNDDGSGLERGKLTQEIQKRLAKRDGAYQKRWDKVWDDELCQKYKRPEHDDYWLWNYDFFNAPIEELRYIKALIA